MIYVVLEQIHLSQRFLKKNSSELRLVNRHHEESHKDLVLGEVILTSLYCAS